MPRFWGVPGVTACPLLSPLDIASAFALGLSPFTPVTFCRPLIRIPSAFSLPHCRPLISAALDGAQVDMVFNVWRCFEDRLQISQFLNVTILSNCILSPFYEYVQQKDDVKITHSVNISFEHLCMKCTTWK